MASEPKEVNEMGSLNVQDFSHAKMRYIHREKQKESPARKLIPRLLVRGELQCEYQDGKIIGYKCRHGGYFQNEEDIVEFYGGVV